MRSLLKNESKVTIAIYASSNPTQAVQHTMYYLIISKHIGVMARINNTTQERKLELPFLRCDIRS